MGLGVFAFLLETVKQHWKETTSFHSLLLKAGSHLNQQHIVAQVPFCSNPLRKSCVFLHAGRYSTLPNPFTFQVEGRPKEDHLKYTFEKSLPSTAVPLPERARVSRGQLSATASPRELVPTAAAV